MNELLLTFDDIGRIINSRTNERSQRNGDEMPEFTKGQKVTPKDYANAKACDPKSLRRVMRSMTESDAQPGSGARWEIEIGSDFEKALSERISRTHNRKTVTASLKA